MRPHRGNVGQLADLSAYARSLDSSDEVEVVTFVPVEREVDAIAQEAGIEPQVQLVLLLVGQFVVGQVGNVHAALLDGGERAVGRKAHEHHRRVADRRRSRVARQRVAGLQRQVRQPLAHVLEEIFLMHVPCCRQVPGGQPSCRAALAQAVGSLVAHGAVQGVASLVAVGSVQEEGHRARAGVADAVVLAALLYLLFEVLVYVERQLAFAVEHAPAVEERAVALDVVELHAPEQVRNVGIAERSVVVSRQSQVVAVHLEVGLAVDTALLQDRDGQRVGVVRVGIEVGVQRPDGGIVHSSVGHGLVAVVGDDVLLCRRSILDGPQRSQFQSVDGLVLQFCLELHVGHVHVHVVVLQLMVNVERGEVSCIVLLRVERSRRVKRE